MKNIRIFAALATALLLFSCQQEEETQYPVIHQDSNVNATSDGESIATSKPGENAVYVSAGTLNLKNSSVAKSGDATSLGAGENAALLVTGSGWLIVRGSNILSSGTCSPALAVTGGKTEGAAKLTGTMLSTTSDDSPAIFLTANSVSMDQGQINTIEGVPAIYVPRGSTATVILNGVICESDILAEVDGTLNLELSQYTGSTVSYNGAIKNNGTVNLVDPDRIWKGEASGSGTLNKN